MLLLFDIRAPACPAVKPDVPPVIFTARFAQPSVPSIGTDVSVFADAADHTAYKLADEFTVKDGVVRMGADKNIVPSKPVVTEHWPIKYLRYGPLAVAEL